LIRECTGEDRKRALAGVKFGRKRKRSDYQRSEAIKRRDAGETLATIAKSYGVDLSMISRLSGPPRLALVSTLKASEWFVLLASVAAMAFDRIAGGHRFAFGYDVCVRSKKALGNRRRTATMAIIVGTRHGIQVSFAP